MVSFTLRKLRKYGGITMKKYFEIPMMILGILAILAAAFATTVPRLVFRFIFSTPKRSTKIPAYYIGTPHYKVSQAGLKVMKSMKSEDAWLQSRDGLRLHAWLFPAEENPKKFVIGVHGYRSYSRPEYAPYIEFYQSLGYSMLLPDDRAHRPSEGDFIGFGVLDRLDCVDWAKYLTETYGKDIEILLHGVSMGGAAVCAASGEPDLPEQVKGIVSDCAFSNAWDVLHHQLGDVSHLPADRILPGVEKLCKKKAGFDFHEFSAEEQVKKARVPMLFVQGQKDQMVPSYMAQKLYDACGSSEKRLLMVPDAGHGESIAFAPDKYHALIRELFNI